MDTRNVIIVGTGAEAHALRHHLQSIRQLGYIFKGFVHVPGIDTQLAGTTGDVATLASQGLLDGPTGVAVDAAGNVYVADAANHTI